MKIQALVVILIFFSLSCSQKPGSSQSPGDAIQSVPQASPQNSPCVKSVCQIKVEDYPQDVAVLIPPYADYKHVTIFFHGFSFGKKRDRNLNAIMDDFEIIKSFQESGTDRILIIPFSSGKNNDYRKFIKNKNDMNKFLANLYKVFSIKTSIEDIHFIGHSGAHVTIQNILKDPSSNTQVSQVTLLDATYSSLEPKVFTNWLKSGEKKMTAIYLKNSATEKMALRLWNLFSSEKPGKEGGINLENTDYLTVIPEAEMSKLPDAHWVLVRKWFGRVL